MARPTNPESAYRVSIHRNGGIRYACTQPATIDASTGKKIYRYIHWGKLDENNKFYPASKFIFSPIEERKKLIFPSDWNLDEIDKLLKETNKTTENKIDDTTCSQDENKLYGHIWLLEKIAEKTGVKEDLIKTFNGNMDTINAILSIAYFCICESGNYNSIPNWQRITKTPYSEYLNSYATTELTKGITNQNREFFIKLRGERLKDSELCSLDSTTKTSWFGSLPDIRWGKNKEHLPLPQSLEVVVYTVDSHMPIYYRSFPGNIPDSRTIETILNDLYNADIKNVIIITDRGYETIKNLEFYIDNHQKIITATKVGQEFIRKKIDDFGEFNYCPENMILDPKERVYSKQYKLEYQILGSEKTIKKSENLILNLYFNPIFRAQELLDIDVNINDQKKSLCEIKEKSTPLEDDKTIKKDFCYYTLTYDKETRILESFEINNKKIKNAKREAGFFAITTHGIDMNADKVLENYKFRDEQEKYFFMMKSTMSNDRQRNSCLLAKEGRLFILFVAQIISCWLSNERKTKLNDKFHSLDSIIQEMRPIRCVEHENKPPFITPFVGKQIEICDALGFPIPDGCAPTYAVRKTNQGKPGRPRKARVVVSS